MTGKQVFALTFQARGSPFPIFFWKKIRLRREKRHLCVSFCENGFFPQVLVRKTTQHKNWGLHTPLRVINTPGSDASHVRSSTLGYDAASSVAYLSIGGNDSSPRLSIAKQLLSKGTVVESCLERHSIQGTCRWHRTAYRPKVQVAYLRTIFFYHTPYHTVLTKITLCSLE